MKLLRKRKIIALCTMNIMLTNVVNFTTVLVRIIFCFALFNHQTRGYYSRKYQTISELKVQTKEEEKLLSMNTIERKAFELFNVYLDLR